MTTRQLLGRIRSSPTLFTALTQTTVGGLSIVSGPLLARTIGSEGRGIVAGATATVVLLSWVCYLGVPQALGYFSGTGRDRRNLVLAICVAALGLTAGGILWAVAPTFAGPGRSLEVAGLRAGACLLPFTGLALCGQEVAFAQGRLRSWNVIRSIPTAGASVGVLTLFAIGHLTTVSALVAYLGAVGVYSVCGTAQLVPFIGFAGPAVGIRAATRFGLVSWLASSSIALFGRVDQVLMVPFSTPERLGRYAVAVTFVVSANLLPSAVGLVAYSRIRLRKSAAGSSWAASRARLLQLGIGANVAAVAIGPWLVPLLFGPAFGSVGLLIAVLAAGQLLNDLWILRVNTLSGVGKPGLAVLPSWASTLTFVGVLLFLARGEITELGAATATLVCALVRPAVFRLRHGTLADALRTVELQSAQRADPTEAVHTSS